MIFLFSPQNPVMEETVWEQYTVTLQKVSPSAATHTHTQTQDLISFTVLPFFSQRVRLLCPVHSIQGGDLNGLTCCSQFMVKEAQRAQITDATDSLLSTEPLPSQLMQTLFYLISIIMIPFFPGHKAYID